MNRLTVVFDDDALYRRLKVRAAEDGVPMKALVQQALNVFLDSSEGDGTVSPAGGKEWNWIAFDRWQDQIRKEEERVSMAYPPDLSDVKKYLYGEEHHLPLRMLAEEPAEYDPR